MKHLWEIEHSYQCNEGNFFTNESCYDSFKSWKDFEEEYKDVDKDYNLMFRFDWCLDDGEDVLKIFWMGQRKGLYRYSLIEVKKEDEPKIIAFLLPFYEHLKKLWNPISQIS